jgi:hypothetical protein
MTRAADILRHVGHISPTTAQHVVGQLGRLVTALRTRLAAYREKMTREVEEADRKLREGGATSA